MWFISGHKAMILSPESELPLIPFPSLKPKDLPFVHDL
jgi:hypothetical protein